MPYEDIGNLTNLIFNKEEPSTFLPLEIILTFIILTGIFADSLIIYIIFRCKRMRTTPNIILANWAIVNLCFLIVAPFIYQIIPILDSFPHCRELVYFLVEVFMILKNVGLMLILILTIDWCLAKYFEELSEKYRFHYKLIIITIWTLILLFVGISMNYFENNIFLFVKCDYLGLFIYTPIFTLVVLLQIYRFFQNTKQKFLDCQPLMLNLATASVCCWVLNYIELIYLDFMSYYNSTLAVTAACLVFSNPLVNFIVLYCQDKDFQTCFLKILRRYNDDYEDANFVLHNSISRPVGKQENNKLGSVLPL